MKTNKNDNRQMTALQFMKEFENTQSIMESIANATVTERKTLMESAFANEDYTDDDGVFDMNSMLDVSVSDAPENQPRYYNTPIDPLTDSDKALIVDEFAKKLATMQKEVIDFSEVGPIATVIQSQLGFKQDIEQFLQDTIQKTSEWMKQQNNTQANVNGAGEQTDGGPTSIKPATTAGPAGVEGGMGDMGMGDMGGIPALDEVPALTDTVATADSIVPPEAEGDMGGDLMGDMGDIGGDIGDDSMGDIGGEEPAIEGGDIGGDIGGEEPAIEGGDIGGEEPAIEGGDIGGEEPAIEDEVGEVEETEESTEGEELGEETEETTEGEEGKEEEEEEDDEATDELLESIKADFLKTTRNPVLESVKAQIVQKHAMQDKMARLESISNSYHKAEFVKVESVKKEKQYNAQLESIASNYKKSEKAKLEAIQHEVEVDSKLNTLIESYQTQASKDSKVNLTARLEAKSKLEKLSK